MKLQRIADLDCVLGGGDDGEGGGDGPMIVLLHGFGAPGDDLVTVAILDNPSNPNFPTFWHARGYGLFAANPLGEKVLPEGKKDFDLTLEPGKSATFHYRVVILDGKAQPQDIEKQYQAFAR